MESARALVDCEACLDALVHLYLEDRNPGAAALQAPVCAQIAALRAQLEAAPPACTQRERALAGADTSCADRAVEVLQQRGSLTICELRRALKAQGHAYPEVRLRLALRLDSRVEHDAEDRFRVPPICPDQRRRDAYQAVQRASQSLRSLGLTELAERLSGLVLPDAAQAVPIR